MRSLIGELIGRPQDARPHDGPVVPYVADSYGGLFDGSTTDVGAHLGAMGMNPTLFRTIRRIAEGVAKWEWWLERDTDARGKPTGEPQPVPSHPALALWEQPNPWMSTGDIMEISQQHLELAGEGYVTVAYAKSGPRIPQELWPVNPARMAPVPDPELYLKGWIYNAPGGEKIPLELDEVLQIKYPHPIDPYRGIAPIESAMGDVQAAHYAAAWNKNYFLNSAEPGGLIKVDHDLSDPEWERLRNRWRASHRGVAAAHRVGILEAGMDWVERKTTMRDMQFAQLREVNDSQVRIAYGMSRTLLGASESETNRATAEAAEYIFGAWTIDPALERWAGLLDRLLMLYGNAGKGLRWCHEDPSPANAEIENASRDSKVSAVASLSGIGFNPVDAAEKMGLPEIQYGLPGADPDRDLLVKVLTGAPTLAPLILPMLGFELPAGAPAALPAAASLRPRALPAANGWRPPWLNAAEADLDAVQDDWEDALDDVMAEWPGILADQRAEIHDQIKAAIDNDDTEALADITVGTTAAAAALKTALVALSEAAADRVVEEAAAQDVTIDPVPAEAAAMAGVAAVTAAVLGAGLAAAAAREALRINSDDTTGEQVADDVDTYLAGLSDATPRAQIGGALTNAQNTARIATMIPAPPATYIASEHLDTNTCDPCEDIDGTEWDDIADVIAAYPAGGYVGCAGRERCRGMPIADWSGTTLEETQEAEQAAAARSLPAPLALAPWLRVNGHKPTLPVG